MSEWIDIAKESELLPGQSKELKTEDYDILIINLNGEYFAIENLCTHDGGNLSTGEIEDDEIICPRHGARFCIKTGEVTVPPAYEDIETFPTRVEGGIIQVLME